MSAYALVVPVLLLVAVAAALEDSCSSTVAVPPGNRVYTSCKALPQLSSALHWTLSSSGNGGNATLSLAFSAPPASPNGWVSWALNPEKPSMFGAQALIAFRQPGGHLGIKTFNISSMNIKPSPIDYEVSDLQAAEAGGRMWIFAKVKIPSAKTVVNQVWQVGSSVTGGIPDKHAFAPDNLGSKGVIDLASGRSSDGGGGSRLRKTNIHGVLNAVSWGILLPVGAIIARYLKTFKSADPAWFYLHVTCQIIGYAVGVAGWATGMDLGKKVKDFPFPAHRDIAIALFTLGTVQLFALFMRPAKDHKYRLYWNIYHHSVGYAVIVLGIINVFKGLSILNPDQKWKNAYILVVSVLGGFTLALEAVTWIIFLRRRSDKSTKLHDSAANGHGGVQQPLTV